jgi:20S proteasome alpha/beta subunit
MLPSSIHKKTFPPPLKHPQYAKSVTIAAGFFVKDGIVVCADRELGGPSKTYEKKIEVGIQCSYGAVVFSYSAYDSGVACAAIRKCSNELTGGWGALHSITQVADLIEETVCKEYQAHVTARDPNAAYNLLIAISWKGKLGIYSTVGGGAIRSHAERCCIGGGTDIALYLVGDMVKPVTHPDVATRILSYVLAETRKYTPGVGGPTDMYVLRGDGSLREISDQDIRNAELFVGVFFRKCQDLMIPFIAGTDSQLDHFLEEFIKAVKSLRQFGLLDDYGRMIRDKRGTAIVMPMGEVISPNPQSTTGDPSPQPPSPEIPGGSDES